MTRVVVDQKSVDALASNPAVLRGIGEIADAVAAEIRRRAPRRTGAAADSIHAEPAPEPREGFRVGWGPDYFYLAFAEYGTETQPARPFARPVVDEINRR